MSSDIYQPISCSLHSEYELAIMHGRILKLKWHDENGEVLSKKLKPVEIKTRDKQEFLVAWDVNNVIYEIRLDKIIHSDVSEKNQT